RDLGHAVLVGGNRCRPKGGVGEVLANGGLDQVGLLLLLEIAAELLGLAAAVDAVAVGSGIFLVRAPGVGLELPFGSGHGRTAGSAESGAAAAKTAPEVVATFTWSLA